MAAKAGAGEMCDNKPILPVLSTMWAIQVRDPATSLILSLQFPIPPYNFVLPFSTGILTKIAVLYHTNWN